MVTPCRRNLRALAVQMKVGRSASMFRARNMCPRTHPRGRSPKRRRRGARRPDRNANEFVLPTKQVLCAKQGRLELPLVLGCKSHTAAPRRGLSQRSEGAGGSGQCRAHNQGGRPRSPVAPRTLTRSPHAGFKQWGEGRSSGSVRRKHSQGAREVRGGRFS